MSTNKPTQLSEPELEKAAGGGTPGAVRKNEADKACSSFVCTNCNRPADQHKIDGNGRGSSSVFTNDNGYWREEWTHYMLDCNHCKFFNHISWSTGECVKDCQ